MTSELLSGPDLGGGFLHQLSVEHDGEPTTFTFHAQDGGSDAGGPSKGPLDVFGFVHPPSPCMFGGPRCWHRRFLLPFAEASAVRRAYNRMRFVLETMVDQVYAQRPVPIARGLEELVDRVASPLAADGVVWYVGGSTAAWLLGASVAPHDIDLGTSRDGVDRLGALLTEYLIEPVAPTDWPVRGIVRGARAFVGTFQEGVRVEWAVPIEPGPPQPFDEWDARSGVPRLVPTPFHGTTVRATRPEYALVRAAEKGRSDRLPALTELVRRLGVDRELLGALLTRSGLPEPARESLRQALA